MQAEGPVMTESFKMEPFKYESLKLDFPSSLSSNVPGAASSSIARRPPRKSTLTQQQKNQKRRRASQGQLNLLEVEFNKDPTPTASVREQIAQDINMTERSVQIWFQNRRAKIKNLAKKSIETGEDCDAIPESMRKYLTMQALESGKPILREMINSRMSANGSGLLMNADSNASKVVIYHFACRSLRIGNWYRNAQGAMDLVVFYSPAKSLLTYYINAESSAFKIEYPFSDIRNITLDSGDISANAEGASQDSGRLIVELNRIPNFSKDAGSGGFFQCRDFTEEAQASQVLTHYLGGHAKVLSGQLAKLVSLECFRNRHYNTESHPLTMSAYEPSIIPRPASQPNYSVNPNIPVFQDTNDLSMGPPPPRGHKRQRSRSVPVAVDFSQLRPSMHPFHLQQDCRQAVLQHHNFRQSDFRRPDFRMQDVPQQTFCQPDIGPQEFRHPYDSTVPYNPQQSHILAPVPQHAVPIVRRSNYGNYAPTFNINLNIDNSQGYNFDFRHGITTEPTVDSKAQCESDFLTTNTPSDEFSMQSMSTPFSIPLLSPMNDASHSANPSVSPLLTLSHHGESVFTIQSPVLSPYDQIDSPEIYTTPREHMTFNDVSFDFNELYSKPAFTLPYRPSLVETPDEEFSFYNMVQLEDTVESTGLSPDNSSYRNCL